MPLRIEEKRRVTYDTGPATIETFAAGGIVLALFGGGIYFDADQATVVIGAAVTAILILSLAQRWTVDCDIPAKRLKVVRKLFGYWSRTKVDCSFDECDAFGVYKADGEDITYRLLIKLRNGERVPVWLEDQSLKAASDLATLLALATGIAKTGVET